MMKLLYGKDTFSSHEALEQLRREIESNSALGGDVTEIDGATAKPEDVLNATQTMPLLGGQRLVIVRGLLGRFQGRRSSRRKTAKFGNEPKSALGDWQSVVDALPQLPESTILIFVDGEASAANPMLAALKKLKGVEIREFPELTKAGEIAAWVRDRAELLGVRLEGRAVPAMADLIGGDFWTIDSELRKLATYAGDEPVSEETVRELVSQVREANAFQFVDAIVEGRTDAAIALLEQLLADGDSPLRLLALIARQYRLLMLAAELRARNVRNTEIAKQLGVHNFVAQRILEQLPPYDMDQLRTVYRRLLEADLSIKRGIYDDETAIELLVYELASGVASRRPGRPGYSRPPAGRAPARAAPARGSSGTR